MGMFDDIYYGCATPLPLPDNAKDYIENNPDNHFQTKDLNCAMDTYKVYPDGTLWLRCSKCELVKGDPKAKSIFDRLGYMKEISHSWERQFTTREIEMGNYIQGKGDYDYIIDYQLKFIDGVLKNGELIKFEKIDNKQRKADHERYVQEMQERKKFVETKRYKYIYSPYNTVLRKIHEYVKKTIWMIDGLVYKIYNKLII
jgi:hypothetical protein